MQRPLGLILLSAFLWPIGAHAQTSSVSACQDRREALRAALLDIHKRQRNIGLSAVVMLHGQTIIDDNLGYADLENRVPVTSATRFGVASITKAFTGLALLKLHEQRRVDLDAPIQRYVPSFPVKPGGAITLRLLAAHLAGIRHWTNERTPALYARHFEDINEVLDLFKNDTLLSPPGSAEHYSSYGYDLIGTAIQAASGAKYQEYVARQIIDPLGLKDTGFDDVRHVLPNRARRYSYYDVWTFAVDSNNVFRVPEWDYSHNMAAGNMYSTATDLARFGRAIEKPGLLSQESLDLLYTRPKVGNVVAQMSFGFFLSGSVPGRRLLNIGGSNAGVQSGLFVYPDEDLVISVISNTWGLGSRSAEMNSKLLARLAAICMGWNPVP